jgi:outer membrane lipoprotein
MDAMKHKTPVILAAAIAVLAAAGCAPPFPKDLLASVDRNVPFADLQKDPDQHRGAVLMLGGTIVDTKNQKEGTQIEVLQKPLDGEGRPEPTDATGGRFVVQTKQFLDAAIFHRGRSITVIGEVVGSKMMLLSEVEYRYPVLSAKDLHLWAPYTGPQFSIGIGVFKGY